MCEYDLLKYNKFIVIQFLTIDCSVLKNNKYLCLIWPVKFGANIHFYCMYFWCFIGCLRDEQAYDKPTRRQTERSPDI